MRKKLIEVALPLEAINAASAREKSIRHGHPSTLHLWWARRPLAAARAILFAQLVDDPSSWPELFPTEEVQNHERQRLFRVIESLVPWENSENESVLNAARLEIARSHARSASTKKAKNILSDSVTPAAVNDYLTTELPPIHDPFAGGGTIPLEAQRLGLRAIASDLNPVAVIINKALIEIPPRFAAMSPVNPDARKLRKGRKWKGAEGLADDVRYYSKWMRTEAHRRIGQHYPQARVSNGISEATVIAWLWARTVPSPNPAFASQHVPLMSSHWLSTKAGHEVWLEPLVDREAKTWRYIVRRGAPGDRDAVTRGTKSGRGDFECLLSGTPIPATYIRTVGQSGRMRTALVAVVCEGKKGREFVEASDTHRLAADVPIPDDVPESSLPDEALGFRVQNYGLTRHADLFSPRQLVALTTFAALLEDVERMILEAPVPDTRDRTEYAKAVLLYLGLGVSKSTDYWSNLCIWRSDPKNLGVGHVFARNAIQMVWDFAEANPFSGSSGSWINNAEWIAKALEHLPARGEAIVKQMDAAAPDDLPTPRIHSTDPPYYDNVPYADLSDFFYVWLRHALRRTHPELFATVLVPKAAELVAEPFRHGGRAGAERFFLEGMTRALLQIHRAQATTYPAAIYYAFKQSDGKTDQSSSTGWETFLDAILRADLTVEGTWPVRTELANRVRSMGSNALASSVVLACKPRRPDGPVATRGELRRLLRNELPIALKKLQQGSIAPVDMEQASIGPGMAVFSRYTKTLESDGSALTVRAAYKLIIEVLGEYLTAGEGDFDADTRFAITWYEQYGWEPGPFGDAETLAKARNVSVSGVVESGICHSAGGKVRILKRSEMRPLDYDPLADKTPTVWEFTQHMIRYLEEQGEERAARLLKRLGAAADATRELAYRLYNTCERKKWAQDAQAYNGLILAWPELEKLAAKLGDEPAPVKSKPAKKRSKAKESSKTQQELFNEDEDEHA